MRVSASKSLSSSSVTIAPSASPRAIAIGIVVELNENDDDNEDKSSELFGDDDVRRTFTTALSSSLELEDDDIEIFAVAADYYSSKKKSRALAPSGTITGYDFSVYISLLGLLSSPSLGVAESSSPGEIIDAVSSRILSRESNITGALAASTAVVAAFNVTASALASAKLRISSATVLGAAPPSFLPAAAASSPSVYSAAFATGIGAAALVVAIIGGALCFFYRRERYRKAASLKVVSDATAESTWHGRGMPSPGGFAISEDPHWNSRRPSRDRSEVDDAPQVWDDGSAVGVVVRSPRKRRPHKAHDYYVSRDMIYNDADF